MNKMLSVIIISVSQNYTRRGIAKKLVEVNYDKAKELGCQGIFTECSAKASQQVTGKKAYLPTFCAFSKSTFLALLQARLPRHLHN